MILRDDPDIELPIDFSVVSYSGADDLCFAPNIIKLVRVELKERHISVVVKNKGGLESSNKVSLINRDKEKLKYLYGWFKDRVGKTISEIYASDFNYYK